MLTKDKLIIFIAHKNFTILASNEKNFTVFPTCTWRPFF